MNALNKKEDAELSGGASCATTHQNLLDHQTTSTKSSQKYSRSASSMTVTISPEVMEGGTEINKRDPKGFRLKLHQKLSKSTIEVREKRKKQSGYRESMNMYMEESKESKGMSE